MKKPINLSDELLSKIYEKIWEPIDSQITSHLKVRLNGFIWERFSASTIQQLRQELSYPLMTRIREELNENRN